VEKDNCIIKQNPEKFLPENKANVAQFKHRSGKVFLLFKYNKWRQMAAVIRKSAAENFCLALIFVCVNYTCVGLNVREYRLSWVLCCPLQLHFGEHEEIFGPSLGKNGQIREEKLLDFSVSLRVYGRT
jgi:hypothetical protein